MSDSSAQHGIENEPHLRSLTAVPPRRSAQGTPSDLSHDYRLTPAQEAHDPDPHRSRGEILHSVWDEPVSELNTGTPAEQRWNYARWLNERITATGFWKSWLLTVGLALVSGPLAAAGAFLEQMQSGYGGVLLAILIAPVTEEVMKAALVLWAIETRPYLFRSAWQIVFCLVVSGLAFAAIENLLYLNIYVPDPSPTLVRWRWTICVLLHVGCTAITAYGLVVTWREVMRTQRRPSLATVTPYLIAAIVTHAIYNLFASFLSV